MDFDPLNQTFPLLGPDGTTQIPVWVPDVDEVVKEAVAIAINYAAQIGACIVMLLVVLTMTARSRMLRATTAINVAGLVVGIIRCTLLALYFTSSYLEFYTFFAHDFSRINPTDTRISVAATIFAVPQLVLIEAALILQAWSVVQLWQALLKWLTVVISALIALFAIGFKCASVSLQVKAIVDFFDPSPYIWVRQSDLAFGTATVIWFCCLFMMRLALHMWKHRSILPPVKGLSAMEALVMTNGVLMLVPVVFAGMEFGTFQSFESGSVTLTSVIIILPLGTLVAQRLAATGTFISQAARYASHSSESKKRFVGTWSHHSNGPSGSSTATAARGSTKEMVDPIDLELQRIEEVEQPAPNGIWVSRHIKQQVQNQS